MLQHVVDGRPEHGLSPRRQTATGRAEHDDLGVAYIRFGHDRRAGGVSALDPGEHAHTVRVADCRSLVELRVRQNLELAKTTTQLTVERDLEDVQRDDAR